LKQRLARIAIGLAIVLFFLGHTLRWYEIGFITQLDNIIYDARLNMTMPEGIDPRVVILDIDEKSLGEVGRWPWSRNLMAQLMEKLFDKYGVLLVGFDVVWAERDTSSGIDTLQALAQRELKEAPGFRSAFERLRPQLDFDGLFAASIKGRPVVLGYYFNAEENAVKANAIPQPVLSGGTFAGRAINFPRWKGYTGNLPEYVKNAAGAGHFNPLVDDDGVSRRVPMILEFEGEYYEALSLAMLRALVALQTGAAPRVEPGLVPPSFDYPGLEWLKVSDYVIPVDDRAAALIPYRGRKFSYPYVALADVLKDRIEPAKLRGRIVGSVFPGVEIHANMITGMLDGIIKSKPPYMLGAEVLLLLTAGVALAVLLPALSALWATVTVVAGTALVTALDFIVWSMADLVLPLATSILMIGAMYTVNMAYGYFVESRSKRLFTELFGQYVPPELVDRMAADPEKYSMEPKAAELTILFSDVRGFTSISEALKPEELREYINQYLTTMSGIIRAGYNGTLDKYIGDAIMAFWGAPVEDPQHARKGVLAALEMQRECKVLNNRFTARGWPALRIGVGVNTGGVRVGDMGSQVRRAYTVMGDPVNVASRLEGRTKTYGVGILVGEATRAAVKDVLFREIDRIKVKGKDEAIAIYEPLCLEAEADRGAREELDLWDAVLAAYRAQRWDEAEANLDRLQRMNPECGLYQAYAERVDAMRDAALPADWDGVTVFHEK
jgi:adenylate cyclase